MDALSTLAIACAVLTFCSAIFWFCVDAPKLFASWRASDAPRKLGIFLRITPCFDGLIRNFKCHHVSGDGELRGQITAEAPLLAETGLMEESAVALLLDSLTGFALWSAGYPGFVTAELSFTVKGTVRKGEELFVKAWLKQKPTVPEDKRLREFANLAFELYQPQPDQDNYAEEAMVASGEQLMLSIAAPKQRFFWKLQLLCPPYWDWKWKMDMTVLESFNQYSKPFSEVRGIDELLELKTKELGTYEAFMSPRLLNVMGVGHGAAIAALLCAAAKRWQKDAKVQKASVTYISPVPSMQPISLVVKPIVTSPNELQIMLKAGSGAVLSRGKVAVQLPKRPPAATARLGGLIRPMMVPLPGGPLSTLPREPPTGESGPLGSTSPRSELSEPLSKSSEVDIDSDIHSDVLGDESDKEKETKLEEEQREKEEEQREKEEEEQREKEEEDEANDGDPEK